MERKIECEINKKEMKENVFLFCCLVHKKGRKLFIYKFTILSIYLFFIINIWTKE